MNNLDRLKQWAISMGSSPFIFKWISVILPWLYITTFIFLLTSLYWGFGIAPADYKQGDVYRIIFIHVPSAILSESGFIVLSLFGFICLVWRAKMAGMLIRAITPVGASFTFLTLLSGSIWGKPTWGTWWVWDARLTSTLILFFIYIAIFALYSSFDDKRKGDRAASILCVVGVIIIPIIKKSVDWWQTLHQPSTFTLTSSPSMTIEMYLPLLSCVLAFYMLFILIVLSRLRVEIISREKNTNWLREELLRTND